jgi:hypothetical protein
MHEEKEAAGRRTPAPPAAPPPPHLGAPVLPRLDVGRKLLVRPARVAKVDDHRARAQQVPHAAQHAALIHQRLRRRLRLRRLLVVRRSGAICAAVALPLRLSLRLVLHV